MHGNRSLLDRVFFNLAENALEFAPDGGQILIESRAEHGARVASGLRFAELSIRDNGPRIAPADLPFIFDPHRQAAAGRSRGGYGLGLAVVARGIAQHNGRVHVRSRLGVGTEFLLYLPVTEPAPIVPT